MVKAVLDHLPRAGMVLCVMAGLLLQPSCVVPGAVSEFTAVSQGAAAQFAPLVKDLSASCIRKQLADRPVKEIADVDEEARAACHNLSDLEPRLLGALHVLVAYLGSLHELASGQTVINDKDLDSFAGNVQAATGFPAPQVQAVRGLAGFMAKAAASGYQARHLAAALQSADGDVAALCEGLGTYAAVDYVQVLEAEQSALRSRYRTALADDASKNPAVALLLQDSWRHELNQLNQRRAAARDVRAILTKIRLGHHELATGAARWQSRDWGRILQPYSESIQALAVNLRTAF